jgi:hypothetical protein
MVPISDSAPQWTMFALFCFILAVLAPPFKSRGWLEVENAGRI